MTPETLTNAAPVKLGGMGSADALWEMLVKGISIHAIEKINTQVIYLHGASNLVERERQGVVLY